MPSDSVKHMPINGVLAISSVAIKPRKSSTFVYAFIITFVAFSVFLAFIPSRIIFQVRRQENLTPVTKNLTFESPIENRATNPLAQSQTNHAKENMSCPDNNTYIRVQNSEVPLSENLPVNSSASLMRKQSKKSSMIESLKNCDFFDGEWVKDNSYPLYTPSSCNLIDPQFNCFSNGRPDVDFQKFKWKPKKCTLPRLNGGKLLEMLRGRRLVFVGDSLNRNMWESLVCILKGSVKDKSQVFEAHGRNDFLREDEYSIVFKDYNCTVEFYVTPFLVQQLEVEVKNGTKKKTLQLDLMEKSSEQYKGADIFVFNTGHWWTNEKTYQTFKGENFYHEESIIHPKLDVDEAFRRALTTWSQWVDKNVNPNKSLVFFRGYSSSHFTGKKWNTRGSCNEEREPFKNETYLPPYPSKMKILERVLKEMKTQVTYLNITRLTDYRKDAHPSMYRKHKLFVEENKLHQDCSHWCLPGVPDSWNEIFYAELLVKLRGNKRRKSKGY